MNTTFAIKCRIRLLLIGFALAFGVKAEKVQVWAKGVSAEGGWQNTFQFRNGCWAGCATDMIDWWQKRIAEKYDYSSIKVWEREELIREYDTNSYFADGGDYIWRALEWVFKNTVKVVDLKRPGDKPGGYLYYQTDDDKESYLISIRGYLYSDRTKVEVALQAFMDAKGNAIAAVSSSSHAWTVYGVEYDTETKRFTKIWATDPYPDSTTKRIPLLHSFDVMYSTNSDECYFLRYIYDEYNGSYNPQEIDPMEMIFLRIDDALLVNSAGERAFKLLGEDTAPFKPIRPSEGATFDTQAAALAFIEAFNKDRPSFITPPEGVPETFDKVRYANLFEMKPRAMENESFSVAVAFTSEARENIEAQVNGFDKVDLKGLHMGGQEAEFATTPGLYYSVLAGENPSDLKVKSSTLATENSLKLMFPKVSMRGFYRVRATLSEEQVQ